jgi:hypothetical protein
MFECWIRHRGAKENLQTSLNRWGLNDRNLARTCRSAQSARQDRHYLRDPRWPIFGGQSQIDSPSSAVQAARTAFWHLATARICLWIRRLPPGQKDPRAAIITHHRGRPWCARGRAARHVLRAARVWPDALHQEPGRTYMALNIGPKISNTSIRR